MTTFLNKQQLINCFVIIWLKRKTHRKILTKKCWQFIIRVTGTFLPWVLLNVKYMLRNDPHRQKIVLTLLYSEGCNKYLALIQWSTTVYWNILKSSVHNCLSQLWFHSSIQSAIWTINTSTISMPCDISSGTIPDTA